MGRKQTDKPLRMGWTQTYGSYPVDILGVVYNPRNRQILIGRIENDPYLMGEKRPWSFFPGRAPPLDGDIETKLKREIREEIGLEVKVNKIIFATIYPEHKGFFSLYYECLVTGGKEEPRENIELKWIKPTEVKKYFTTSIHPKIMDYLKRMESK